MDKIVVGIDLGTTFSSVAYIDDKGCPIVIPNSDGKSLTPSVVLVEDDNIVVGEVALNQWITNEEQVVRWIKRAMGDRDYQFQGMSAVEISAEILKALKADAELELGQSLDEAVITCPAYFAANEIENTKLAGELAGFNVREIVKEPTAAAVHYGVENLRKDETILVCDLGGGTFDATVLAYQDEVFIPRASRGSRELGGHDWTMDLMEMVSKRFQEQYNEDPRNDLVAGQMLYEACEQAKRDFARITQVTIPCHFQSRMEHIVVTRDEFESETEWRMRELVAWSEEALEKAQLTWEKVDRILLVGGSSRLRRMELALEESSGKKPVRSQQPDLTVAIGAAILARGQVRPRRGGLVDIDYKRILERNLGTRVIVFDGDTPHITNSQPIIRYGTEIPASGSRDDFKVVSAGQECFDVPVVEFESEDEYEELVNYRFQCLPNARRGDRIKVTFHYDVSGSIPSVEAVDLGSREPLAGERRPYQEPDLEDVMRVRVRPRWVVFAVDVSYSMKDANKIENAKKALFENARNLLAVGGENYKIGIVSFASNAKIVCHPTSDLDKLERAVTTLSPSGMTAMDEGIRHAVDLAMAAPAGTDRDVVMITDGMPDKDRRQSTLAAADEARAKLTFCSLGVSVHSDDVDTNFLKKLTDLSLGIDDPDEMTAATTKLLGQSAAARESGLKED